MVTSSPPPLLLAPDPKPIHFLKAYDNSYSKMNREHKYKDKDEYKYKIHKYTSAAYGKVPERPNTQHVV